MVNARMKVAEVLKVVARDQQLKEYVQQSKELYPLLQKVANRYITGESRQKGLDIAKTMIANEYSVSLEYIGENTSSFEECELAKQEFLKLIEKVGELSTNQTVSFDLSHIGLNIDTHLAYSNLRELAEKADQYNVTLIISMEESSKTDAILQVYKQIAQEHHHVGITIQAHLYRSIEDVKELIHLPGRIRVVKGAYQESHDFAIPRSEELNDRFLEIIDFIVSHQHSISIATHDETILRELEKRQYLKQPHVELEMLYGIQTALLREMKQSGYSVRLYLLYGHEWYLYLCHRLAENPDNLFVAITDMLQSSNSVVKEYVMS